MFDSRERSTITFCSSNKSRAYFYFDWFQNSKSAWILPCYFAFSLCSLWIYVTKESLFAIFHRFEILLSPKTCMFLSLSLSLSLSPSPQDSHWFIFPSMCYDRMVLILKPSGFVKLSWFPYGAILRWGKTWALGGSRGWGYRPTFDRIGLSLWNTNCNIYDAATKCVLVEATFSVTVPALSTR